MFTNRIQTNALYTFVSPFSEHSIVNLHWRSSLSIEYLEGIAFSSDINI